MATSQAVFKRRIDWDDGAVDPCHRNFSPIASPPISKRARLDVVASNFGECNTPTRTSPFVPPPISIDSLIEMPKKKVKLRLCNRCGNSDMLSSQGQLFTISEVQNMIQNAVQTASDRIKIEYDAILHQQMCDQFNTFTKFNQDYISRQVKRNELSYLS
uniref:Uncharacterized protein n=1 Tax=Spongospora subterranea TaxID=70186 RepID=A0A0H5QHF9_9EUKA|eukprot:CRZ01450.1 hypothetical protein [Spongospora subterranea]